VSTPIGKTVYSKKIPGAPGNYGWPVTFAKTDGYVLIYQEKELGIEAVLISPAQLRELIAFTPHPAKRRSKKPAAAKKSRRASPRYRTKT
jgi:hypothetical protein